MTKLNKTSAKNKNSPPPPPPPPHPAKPNKATSFNELLGNKIAVSAKSVVSAHVRSKVHFLLMK